MVEIAAPEELTMLVNHADIRRHFGIPENMYVSMKEFYHREGNVAFTSPAGCMIFGLKEPGTYECHFLFRPGSKDIIRYARQMHDELFTNYGAHVIKGYPPRSNRAVRTLGVALGYEKTGSNHIDGLGRTCEIYELRRDRWATLLAA